jgi:hypothetical protein
MVHPWHLVMLVFAGCVCLSKERVLTNAQDRDKEKKIAGAREHQVNYNSQRFNPPVSMGDLDEGATNVSTENKKGSRSSPQSSSSGSTRNG